MTEEKLYQELAELKLQNRLLDERLKMMTSMCNGYMDTVVDVCHQLQRFDLVLVGGKVTKKVIE